MKGGLLIFSFCFWGDDGILLLDTEVMKHNQHYREYASPKAVLLRNQLT